MLGVITPKVVPLLVRSISFRIFANKCYILVLPTWRHFYANCCIGFTKYLKKKLIKRNQILKNKIPSATIISTSNNYRPQTVMYINSFTFYCKHIIDAALAIFNKQHAVVNLNIIYQSRDNPRKFMKVRARTDTQADELRLSNNFELFWKVLKIYMLICSH